MGSVELADREAPPRAVRSLRGLAALIERARGRSPRVLRLLPGVAALVAVSAAAVGYDTQIVDVVRVWLAVAWSMLVPGVLLLRVLRGRPAQLVTELALGGVIGLTVQLLAWAVAVGAGRPGWLVGYPLLVMAGCALLPSRRAVFAVGRYPVTLHPAAAWGLAATFAASVWQLAVTAFRVRPLPPQTGLWYQDLYWHLSIAAVARHTLPPVVPQLGDETLFYHWFSNAHMAAESLVSGVDVIVVVGRLWYLPIYALITLTTFALTYHLTRRAWAGVGAAVLLVVAASVQAAPWLDPVGQQAYMPASPSQLFALPFTVVGVWLLGDVLRGRAGPRDWVLLGLVLAGTSGAKVSALPVLLAGVGLALVVALLIRTGRLRALRAFLLVGGLLALSSRFVAPRYSGSTFGVAGLERGYALVEDQLLAGTPESTVRWLVTGVVVLVLVQFLYLAPGLALLHRDTRRHPTFWVLLGALLSAQLAMLLITHPGQSQLYFVRGVLPLGTVFAMWGLVRVLGRARDASARRTVLGVAAGWVLLGLAISLLTHELAGSSAPGVTRAVETVDRLGWFWLVLSVGVLGIIVATALVRHRGAQLAGLVVSLTVLALATVPAARTNALFDVQSYRTPATVDAEGQLTPSEIDGTAWVRKHTPERDLIATNVYCVPAPTRPHCDARAFWVTGLSERAAFLGAWAYEDQNSLNLLHDPLPTYLRAFWDPSRLALNDAAFASPTAAILHTLYRRGVRWLFADAAASPVSPGLASLADLRFASGTVAVYRLRPPAG